MGGRGGESGLGKNSIGIRGLDITTTDGETTRYYFAKNGITNYYQKGIDGTPQPTPFNMSMDDFKKRVQSNGAFVREVTSIEQKADEKAYDAQRAQTDAFLNSQWYKAGPKPKKGMKGH